MKEPDLEEESLRLTADKGDLVIERQTLEESVGPVTLTMPDGTTRDLTLAQDEPGRFRARLPKAPLGLYKAVEGDLTALAHVGPTDPKEYRSLLSTPEIIRPISAATGGTVQRLRDGAEASLAFPRIVPMRGGTTFGGSGWLGLDMSDAYEVTGLDRTRLFGGFLGLALLLLAIGGTWWREGR